MKENIRSSGLQKEVVGLWRSFWVRCERTEEFEQRVSQLVLSDYVTQVTLLKEWSIRKRDRIRDSTIIPIRDDGELDQEVQDVEDSEKELPSGYFETMLIDQVLFERLWNQSYQEMAPRKAGGTTKRQNNYHLELPEMY